MSDWPVRLVLDSSAILEFCRGSVHVGEILAEFRTDRTAAAVPVACLAEAYPLAVEPEHLDLLVAHDATVMIEDDAEQWRALGHLCGQTDGYAAASAALTAIDQDCWVLTSKPGLYESVAGGELAIEISD